MRELIQYFVVAGFWNAVESSRPAALAFFFEKKKKKIKKGGVAAARRSHCLVLLFLLPPLPLLLLFLALEHRTAQPGPVLIELGPAEGSH